MLSLKIRREIVRIFKIRAYEIIDHLAEREYRAKLIRERCEDGQIAIVYGGMDCDCSRWDDCVALLPATTVHMTNWVNRYYENAEGPHWHRIERPSAARKLIVNRRDCALEAFEDGHSHVVYH